MLFPLWKLLRLSLDIESEEKILYLIFWLSVIYFNYDQTIFISFYIYLLSLLLNLSSSICVYFLFNFLFSFWFICIFWMLYCSLMYSININILIRESRTENFIVFFYNKNLVLFKNTFNFRLNIKIKIRL